LQVSALIRLINNSFALLKKNFFAEEPIATQMLVGVESPYEGVGDEVASNDEFLAQFDGPNLSDSSSSSSYTSLSTNSKSITHHSIHHPNENKAPVVIAIMQVR
jgi:hypothetical protein